MRTYAWGSAVVGLGLAAEACLWATGVLERGALYLGWVAYLWFVGSLLALGVSLRRGESPWLPLSLVVYALADSFYGFYLIAHQADPSQLQLPPWVLWGHGLFG